MDNTNQSKNRRRIVPTRIETDNLSVTVIPSIETLMNDALSIIGSELASYKRKTKSGITLELKEARSVQGYMDTLIKLSKENREQIRAEDLSNLSDEELKQLATKLLTESKE